MKHFIIAIFGMPLALSSPANAQSPQSPTEIANLSVKGLAQFQCAILASFGKTDLAHGESLFHAGYNSFHQFLTLARSSKDPKVAEAIADKSPMIVTLSLGGPNIDFEIGRVYSAILQYVDDELNDRETWTHQKKEPKADNIDREIIKIRAEGKYREQNCSIIGK